MTTEGAVFVAQCLEYDVASQGATKLEALSNLAEAVALHVEDDGARASKRPEIAQFELHV